MVGNAFTCSRPATASVGLGPHLPPKGKQAFGLELLQYPALPLPQTYLLWGGKLVSAVYSTDQPAWACPLCPVIFLPLPH